MRYLAVVQRKGLLGQQELQLLARETGEYAWGATRGETLSFELLNRLVPGTLVMAEIGPNNQIQRVEAAAASLVGLLQGFSRLKEALESQIEEIESWKQSLHYQSQELNRRELEMQRDRDALQQWQQPAQTEQNPDHAFLDQITRLRSQLESLDRDAEIPDEEDRLAADRAAWQINWQACIDAFSTADSVAVTLEADQQGFAIAWQALQTRRAVRLAALDRLSEERIWILDQQTLLSSQPLPTTSRQEAGLLQAQRKLSEQQLAHQQRASLVSEQEEEMQVQEGRLTALRTHLGGPHALSQEERAEFEEELQLLEQSCLTQRESLAQQHRRLRIDQEKLDQQVASLQTLIVGTRGSTTTTDRLDRLGAHLQERLGDLDSHLFTLATEEQTLIELEQYLDRTRLELDSRRTDLANAQGRNQGRLGELQGQQRQLEKRQVALEVRRSLSERSTHTLIAELDRLVGSVQAN